ncbi:hypothetical protein Tco_1226423 [Tanacetum coccineum]
MLWGDLHTLFEPDEEDEIWKDQHEYKLLIWRLYDFCGIHILLMENGLAIHMLTEKKYPLSQEMLTKMLSKKLEVDHESSQAFELLSTAKVTSIPTTEIFEQLALMGYHTDPDKLTFQKAAVICLATNRKFNFSRMIFEHMVSNISSPHKFLMYPRFIQICLDMQRHQFQQHTRTYPVPSLTMKVFSNMKRPTKGFSGQEVALFPTMLAVPAPSTSPSRITSSPSPTPSQSTEPTLAHTSSPTQPSPTQPSPTQPSPTQPSPTQPGPEHQFSTPHDSPLHVVHSHGSDEGSLKLQELMNLVTTLSDRIGILEADLMKTKKTYSSAYTKLILRVKKLKSLIKIGKARKQARVVLLDDESFEDDSSKQGRKLFDEEVQEKASTDTELLIRSNYTLNYI